MTGGAIAYLDGGTTGEILVATLKFKAGIGVFPMSDSARYARMSDPDLNRHFRRRWSEPANVPSPYHFKPTASRVDDLRHAAEALFSPAPNGELNR